MQIVANSSLSLPKNVFFSVFTLIDGALSKKMCNVFCV